LKDLTGGATLGRPTPLPLGGGAGGGVQAPLAVALPTADC
jgi:hypothetical protein